MAKDKESKESGEFKLGEITATMEAVKESLASVNATMNTLIGKMDTMSGQLAEGTGKFKDLEHADQMIGMRLSILEKAKEESSNTKQSIMMMFLDKGIGIILPWGAVAYMLWGHAP